MWVAHPPLLGGKHSRSLGDGPKHPGPPLLFIPGLPSFSEPGLPLQPIPELEVLIKVPRACTLLPYRHWGWFLVWAVLGLISQKSVPRARRSWESGILGCALGLCWPVAVDLVL